MTRSNLGGVLGLLTLAMVLSACESDPAPQLHDLYVSGVLDQQISWFYGEPRVFDLGGASLTLTDAPEGLSARPWTVVQALWVDGEPAIVAPWADGPAAPVEVNRIPLTTDLRVRTMLDTSAIVYYDGSAWLSLGEFDPAGLDHRVSPRPRLNRLRGLGELTAAEADLLAARLEQLAEPLVVSFLTGGDVPRRSSDGLSELRSTAVHVSQGLSTDLDAFEPPPRDVPYEVVASGQQAIGVRNASYLLLRDREEFSRAWAQAHASQLTPPAPPVVDPSRETLVAVFMGERPSGGYAVSVRGVAIEQGDLVVELSFSSPAPGSMTTMALTSPWLILRVPRSGVPAVWFRDADTGRLMAVARRE